MNMPAMRSKPRLRHASEGMYPAASRADDGRWDVTVTVTRGGERLGSMQRTLMAR